MDLSKIEQALGGGPKKVLQTAQISIPDYVWKHKDVTGFGVLCSCVPIDSRDEEESLLRPDFQT